MAGQAGMAALAAGDSAAVAALAVVVQGDGNHALIPLRFLFLMKSPTLPHKNQNPIRGTVI
jgi:hypothetical protein